MTTTFAPTTRNAQRYPSCEIIRSPYQGDRFLVAELDRRRDGPTVRFYSRNAYDWTVRRAALAAAAELIKATSFTIDDDAVVLGPDGLSRFEELPVGGPLEPRPCGTNIAQQSRQRCLFGRLP